MIIFKKHGIFFDNDINPEHEDYILEKVDSIVPYLGELIEFDDNFTMRDFFTILEEDEEMLEKIFSSHLGKQPLRQFFEEALSDCIPDGRAEMDCIKCEWSAEQFDYHLFYAEHINDESSLMAQFDLELHEPTDDDVNEVSIYLNVHGWGKYIPSEEENYDDNEPPTHIYYAIELTPLNRLAHLPLKLDHSIVIKDRNELSDESPIIEGNMYCSVFDAVGAIFAEISFYGDIEARNHRWQDIVDEARDSKETYEDIDEEEGDE